MRHIMQQSETQQVTEITETGKLPFGGSLVKVHRWASVDAFIVGCGSRKAFRTGPFTLFGLPLGWAMGMQSILTENKTRIIRNLNIFPGKCVKLFELNRKFSDTIASLCGYDSKGDDEMIFDYRGKGAEK